MKEKPQHITGQETSQGPDIFQYFDYRFFLQDFYKFRKEINPKFSYRVFARISGMKSLHYLKMIIAGQRNLTDNYIKKVGMACSLKPNELKYFITLVRLNQSTVLEEKKMYWKELMKLVPKTPFYVLRNQELNLLTDWRSIAIMEMFNLYDAKWGKKWVADRFNGTITDDEIDELLSFLESQGLVQKGENGEVKVKNEIMYHGGDIPSEKIRMYHVEVGKNAIEIIHKLDVNRRHFAANTLAIREEDLFKIKKEIQLFQEKILRMVGPIKSADHVYQLNIQFFQLTNNSKNDSGEAA